MSVSSIQVFEYLLALKNITVPVVRKIQDYKEKYWWQGELPIGSGCLLTPKTKGVEAWLEVYKQEIKAVPEVPEVLIEWLRVQGNEPDEVPEVHRALLRTIAGQQEEVAFAADGERVALWEKWLTKEWKPWAAETLPKIKIQRLYGELFALAQRLQREGDSIEILWGHGLLTWQVNNVQVYRPVFTTRMELLFDAKRGVFTLVPTSSGTVFELDMLSKNELPDLDQLVSLERKMQEKGINPWEQELTNSFLQQLVATLSPQGIVAGAPISGRGLSVKATPVIYNAPVILVRSMLGRQWHTELQAVIEEIRNDHYVPETIEALVSMDVMDQRSEQQRQEQRQWQAIGDEVLFPLPANEEQRDIVRKLSKNIGVVVQGPPGTGKSHTIVNLIAHLLAHGKRVLITSQTERALRVIGEMIRIKLPEIAPLCVSVMGGDARSVQELELSVTKISEGLDQVNVDRIGVEIDQLRQDLRECKEKIVKIKTELGQARAAEHQQISFAGEEFTPLELGHWLATHEQEYGWLPDEVDDSGEIPLSDVELIRLYDLLKELTAEDIDQVTQQRPSLESLSSADEIVGLKVRLSELEKGNEGRREQIKGWTFTIKANSKAPKALQVIEKATTGLGIFSEGWLMRVLEDIVYGENRVNYWQRLMIDCKAKIRAIRGSEHRIAEVSFEIPANSDLGKVKADIEILRSELINNEKPSLMFKMFHGKKTLYLLQEFTMNGSRLRTVEDLDLLSHYIGLIEARTRLAQKWNHSISIVNGPVVEKNDATLPQVIERCMELIQEAFDWKVENLASLIEVVTDHNPDGAKEWTKRVWLDGFAQGIIAKAELLEYSILQREVENFSAYLKNGLVMDNPHPSWGALYDAYCAGDGSKWQKTLLELRKLHSSEVKVGELLELKNRLAVCAPRWVAQLENKVKSLADSQPPTTWRTAWEWKRADLWLKQYVKDNRLAQLYEGLHEAQNEEARLIQTIVSKSTWLEQNQRTTEVQRRSLRAWAQTIRKIGKGTGKYAAKHQADAQKEMGVCRGAVPVWIMPLNRVIENFKPSEEPFDVVIVDESSQSDLFALSALFRGKRAIIVGDDRQISPEAVGKDQEEVNDLIERYLLDVPQRERFTLQDSLYDTSLRIFPGQQIMLKEHFRCVPEIIDFNNREFYGGMIEPLRVPTSDRLLPAVAAVRVEGYRTEGTTAINQPEAAALVAKIMELCNNAEYSNKTMGVISLQGKEQAYVIEENLRQKLGESEMVERKIICGDAYSFQGDERDIIFLSMVAAPNVRSGVLNKSTDEQRFNVATSRAREQLWLFHSVELADLHTNCMRYRLLQHCQQATIAKGKPASAADIFQKYGSSQFRQDVYQMIVQRGYQASAEFIVGTHPYRIPIVIEGNHTRLAVACDGDVWHGIERWEEELERQNVLKRVGWKFWRIRGSQFYRDRQQALEPLWVALGAMGIEPQIK